MTDIQAIADRVEIEALCGESMDAQMMNDVDRFASLFAPGAVWRVPAVDAEFPGNTASGRSHVLSFGRFQNGYLDTTSLTGSAPHVSEGA